MDPLKHKPIHLDVFNLDKAENNVLFSNASNRGNMKY